MRRLKNLIFLVSMVLCYSRAFAADVKLHSANPAKPSTPSGTVTQLYVQFETPVSVPESKVQCGSGLKQCADTWSVVYYDGSGAPHKVKVQSAITGRHFASRGLVKLTLEPLTPGFSRVDVTFRSGKNPHVSFEHTEKPKKHLIKPADTCDKADVCISGSVVPAVGSGPTYNIDSKANYTFVAFGKSGANTFAGSAAIKTDSRPTADPDSFHWGLPLQHVSTGPYTLTWSLIGMDFDKKAQAMNLVSAPSATWILGKTLTKKNAKIPNVTDVLASVGLDLTAGVEFGDNLRNDFAVVNKNSNGEGWFFRGVPAVNAYLVVPDVLKLKKISISSGYTARILVRDELFLETRHTKDPVPKLLSGTRNYLEDNISFMVTDYLGFQIKHKFGELPPAFKFANHSVSIGLVYAFSQTTVP